MIAIEEEHIARSSVGGSDDLTDRYSADPLFLQNSYHLGMTLVSSVLVRNNRLAWCRSIRIALGAKLKPSFINGKCICFSEDTDYE